MKTWLLIVAVALAPFQSQARLGEDEVAIGKRYGRVIHSGPSPIKGVTFHAYLVGGMMIVVGFWDGKSVVEQYGKADDSKLSDTEVQVLMSANAGGKTWKLSDAVEIGKKNWVLEDGSILATFEQFPKSSLRLTTGEAALRAGEMAAEEEKQKLKGF